MLYRAQVDLICRQRSPLSQPHIHSRGPLPLLFPLAVPIHPILHSQPGITARLENTAHLEGPRHLVVLAQEKKAHFHGVTHQPVGQHGEAEPLAGARLRIGKDLWERQRGFNGKSDVTNEERIWRGGRGVEYGVKGKEKES